MSKPKKNAAPEAEKEKDNTTTGTNPEEASTSGAEAADQDQTETVDNKDADIRAQLEKLSKELAAQKESYLRLAAEYDNYRRRTQQEKLSIYSDATAKAVVELLPLADSVAAAQGAKGQGDCESAHKKGIELIGSQLAKSFEKLSVTAFGEIGDGFNPEIHNAISMTTDENLPESSIAQVFQKGFKIGDKIIRPAMVQVANCG